MTTTVSVRSSKKTPAEKGKKRKGGGGGGESAATAEEVYAEEIGNAEAKRLRKGMMGRQK